MSGCSTILSHRPILSKLVCLLTTHTSLRHLDDRDYVEEYGLGICGFAREDLLSDENRDVLLSKMFACYFCGNPIGFFLGFVSLSINQMKVTEHDHLMQSVSL